MFCLGREFAHDEYKTRLEETHRHKAQQHAFRQHHAKVKAQRKPHGEQRAEPRYRGERAARHGKQRLFERLAHGGELVAAKSEFVVIGVRQENRIVYRQGKLQNRRHRERNAGHARENDVGAQVYENGHPDCYQENKRVEPRFCRYKQNDEYNQHRHNQKRRHVAEGAFHHGLCFHGRTAEMVLNPLVFQQRRYVVNSVIGALVPARNVKRKVCYIVSAVRRISVCVGVQTAAVKGRRQIHQHAFCHKQHLPVFHGGELRVGRGEKRYHVAAAHLRHGAKPHAGVGHVVNGVNFVDDIAGFGETVGRQIPFEHHQGVALQTERVFKKRHCLRHGAVVRQV